MYEGKFVHKYKIKYITKSYMCMHIKIRIAFEEGRKLYVAFGTLLYKRTHGLT